MPVGPRVLLTAALSAFTPACSGGGEMPGPDGGSGDAKVIDSEPRVDADRDGGTPNGAEDAGAPDGSVWHDAAACPTEPCDPRRGRDPSCGISGVCVLDALGPRCDSELEGIAEDRSCASAVDCAEGLACFQSRDGGVCGRICCPGDPEACGDEMRCSPSVKLIGGADTSWGRCMQPRACDVLQPVETCEPGEGCYIVSESGDTDCRPAGAAERGADCERQNDCAPGFFCAGLTSGTCVRICSTDDSSGPSCPAGEGACRVYSQSPEGTGLCTEESR